MYRVKVWWAGHLIPPEYKPKGEEAVSSLLNDLQKDLNNKNIKCETVGTTMYPTTLYINV